MLRKILIAASIVICLHIVGYAQLRSCLYFAGCTVWSYGSGCEVRLDKVTCSESIIGENHQCFGQCKTDCSCSCRNSFIGNGKVGVIDFYDTCFERFAQEIYECNNCGNPYPTPTPTPTPPPPPPCVEYGNLCWWNGDCCSYACNENNRCGVSCLDGCPPGWICFGGECVEGSPILIDVLGNGFDLSDAAGGVAFDITSDGVKEDLSWTTLGTDDAWLALDRNNNGVIDGGGELFGNFTGQPTPPAGEKRNGFLALAQFDRGVNGGNSDGLITQTDSIFSSLRLWQDTNHNGTSEPSELHILTELGIAALELRYQESKRTDEHGNRFRYRAKVKDIHGGQAGRWAWDVFLVSKQ